MNPARWKRLQELFEALLEQAPAEREAWLAAHESDPALRAEALALAANHDAAEPVLTQRLREVADAVVPQPASGMRLGPYVLIREIGSGGMGTVFLAERVDAEYDRKVAIKLIRGIPTSEATQRLRRERQILANLSHPNIAPLLDGGTSDAGQPYLVMEFIEGPAPDGPAGDTPARAPTISEYCSAHALPLRKRLQLLQQVCRAVHYAHQRLVIHRDLKPANVLVRSDGTPVLLDFGIAKLLDSEASGQQTQTGVPWFTPAYASPEQRTGRTISTATDIYALGTLLYQLLTDAVPRTDADGRLPMPSTGKSEGAVGSDRELDIIVAKASHPEPDRRYASAEALANDIERYLRGRPIQAAPDSAVYRIGKFARRHRWALAAVAAMLVMAVVMFARLAIENERARRAEARAHVESATAGSVVEYLVSLFDAASPDKIGKRMISPIELVDTGVREARRKLAEQPQPRARLLFALGEIYSKLGKGEQAIAVIEEAVATERDLSEPAQLARYLAGLGTVLNASERHGAAIAALREARGLLEAEAEGDPGLRSEVLTSLSLAQARTGQIAAAIADAEESARWATKADGGGGERLGEANNALSEAHWRNGDLAIAQQIAERNIRRLVAEGSSGNAVLLAETYLAAILVDQGERDRAESLLRDVIAERLKTLDASSDWLITLRNQLATVLRVQGKPLETTELLRQNLLAMEQRGETDTPSYMIALNNLGSMQDQIGDYAAAEPNLREALRLALAEHDPASARPDIYRQSLGRVLMLAGKQAEALPLLEPEIVDDGSDDRRIARLRRLIHLAEWNRLGGRLEAAEDFVRQAEANVTAVFGPGHLRASSVARERALVERDRGDLAAAEVSMRRALQLAETGFGPESNPVVEIRVELADLQLRQGKQGPAAENLQASQSSVRSKFVPGSPTSVLFDRLGARVGVATSAASPSEG
ncbi:serine/threonine-protein kinase [Dokdonella immobilis]|uniref:Serine/threonine protein kinase n=1 Tax=Dokdonella immobilis TaxID=578942 RepID=A0A1I4W7T1_9GAMM|nr:serine/threonine-protein kinase [Dokdonella immobilis]SFN09721.1 serine/threonine protein kinase [Dokdonella immobilis]